MKDLPFGEAKKAIGRSKSPDEIRRARDAIEHIGDTPYHVPFEFPIASELLEVYLQRKALPYATQKNARTYLSAEGKVQYDSLAVGQDANPTYIFGISAENKHSETRGLQTPTFEEVVAHAPQEQPSVTNIIDVNNYGLVVFKAFLRETTGAMARKGISRSDAQSQEDRAIKEVEQLELLKQVLQGTDVYSPRVIGRNGAVVAMEYIQGENMSARTLSGQLNEEDFVKVADVLATLHRELPKKADYIRERFEIPKEHTANSVVCFGEKAFRLKKEDRNREIPDNVYERFTSLIQKAHASIVAGGYGDFTDVIFGDVKDENMILMPDGKIAVLDPVLCAGRNSMDIAKFGRSIIFKKPHIYEQHFGALLKRYRESSQTEVSDREIAQMLGIDMINIMRGYLTIPAQFLTLFPPAVKSVRDRVDFYLSIVERALEGELSFPSAP